MFSITKARKGRQLYRFTPSFLHTVRAVSYFSPYLVVTRIWEDAVYNYARHVKTLRVEVSDGVRRWRYRSPVMAAGLTDHIWSIRELLTVVPVPVDT